MLVIWWCHRRTRWSSSGLSWNAWQVVWRDEVGKLVLCPWWTWVDLAINWWSSSGLDWNAWHVSRRDKICELVLPKRTWIDLWLGHWRKTFFFPAGISPRFIKYRFGCGDFSPQSFKFYSKFAMGIFQSKNSTRRFEIPAFVGFLCPNCLGVPIQIL